MTGKRGRPPDPEDERWQRAQTARRTVDEELAAMQHDGLIPSPGKANNRAARRLGISTKTLKRLLAVDPRMSRLLSHMGRVATDPRGTIGSRSWDDAGLASAGTRNFFQF